jgi:oligoendopeptidase F
MKNSYATKWDLTPIFANPEAPEIISSQQQAKKISQAFINKWKPRTDYLKKPKILRQALDEYEEWERTCGPAAKATYYFSLLLELDQSNSDLKAKFNKAKELSLNIENDIQFFLIRLSRVTPTTQKKFLNSKDLKPYHHFLSRLFAESSHILSEEEEKIMNLKSLTSYHNWVRLTNDLLSREEREVLDENGKKSKKSLSDILGLLGSQKKKVRDTAAKALNDILAKHVDVAEAEINSVLENKKNDDELRKFQRADSSRLLADDIESEIVDTMIESVAKRFDTSAKFYQLKAKLLKVDKLAYHERSVPYGREELRFTYDEAIDRVIKVFAQLDPRFADILSNMAKSGKIDALPMRGKAKGAFCSGQPISSIPTLILLNFTGLLQDVLTIAHEAGHAINFELTKEAQNSLNFGSPLSTAEVASTYMEDFVLSDIMQDASDETRLTLLIHKLDEDISTIFRQAAAYRFEQELHHTFKETGYVSKEILGNLFNKHMKSYMGPAVEQSKGCENWWVHWGHFRSPFYVYSYVSGQLISKAMQRKTKNNPEFISKVKEFLSAGASDSPKNIFAKMGIDITRAEFWQEGLDEISANLNEAIKLAKKLKKI